MNKQKWLLAAYFCGLFLFVLALWYFEVEPAPPSVALEFHPMSNRP